MKNGRIYDHCDGYSIIREREELFGTWYPYYSFPNLVDRYTTFLNEGLVVTYPFNKLILEIEKVIGRCYKMRFVPDKIPEDDPNRIMWIVGGGNFDSPTLDGILHIRFPKPKDYVEYDKLIEHVEHVLTAFGYFIVNNSKRSHQISIESKIGKDVTKDIKEHNDFLYHITPFMYADKISKNGLSPLAKNVYNFPPRIYLFTDSILDKYKEFAKELYIKKPKFFNIMYGDTDAYKKYVRYDADPKKYALLKISLDGINSPLYIDPNFSSETGLMALYTTGNISPKYLSHENTFVVNVSKNKI